MAPPRQDTRYPGFFYEVRNERMIVKSIVPTLTLRRFVLICAGFSLLGKPATLKKFPVDLSM